jgi:hypothetical protein
MRNIVSYDDEDLPSAWKIRIWSKAQFKGAGRSDCHYNPDPAQAKHAGPTDLYETVKKAEGISCAIQSVFDNLCSISGGPRLLSRKDFEGVEGDYEAEGRSAAATYLVVPSAK